MNFSDWRQVKLSDVIEFNPKETIRKGELAKKIGMDKLNTFQRKIDGYEIGVYSGGTKFRNGDTLLARITPCLENGKTAQVTILEDNEVGFGSTEYIVLRKKKNITENDFIYYLSLSQYIRDIAIKSMTGTSGRQRAQTDVIENSTINLPPLNEQKAIAHVLSTLDEKIEVNNKINKTLENIAQVIFNRWFVDFEFPNEEGEPYKSSGGEMAESDLGQIPNDWLIGKFTDVINVLSGGTPKTNIDEYWNGGIPFFTPRDTNGMYSFETEKYISKSGLEKCNSHLYKKDTVFITSRGTVGKVALAGAEMAMNQSCYALVGNDGINQYYVYFKTLDLVNELRKNSTGSVFNSIVVSTFESIKIVLPNYEILNLFSKLIHPIFNNIHNFYMQNLDLIKIRDSLLPKLMSGEIRVPIEE